LYRLRKSGSVTVNPGCDPLYRAADLTPTEYKTTHRSGEEPGARICTGNIGYHLIGSSSSHVIALLTVRCALVMKEESST